MGNATLLLGLIAVGRWNFRFAEGRTLRSDSEGILEATVTAFALGDIDSTLAYFDEAAELAVFIPEEVHPFGGTYSGRAAIAKRLKAMSSQFMTERYVARTILPLEDGLRVQIDYSFCHRPTGQSIDGVKRVLTAFAGGRITRWYEFHDAGRVEAFMRLIRSNNP